MFKVDICFLKMKYLYQAHCEQPYLKIIMYIQQVFFDVTSYVIHFAGPFAFAEVDMQSHQTIEIRHIPSKFPDIINKRDIYCLIGMVHYIGRNDADSKVIGHYTAICLRQKMWVQYDDLNNTRVTKITKNTKVNPALLIYIRQDRVI